MAQNTLGTGWMGTAKKKYHEASVGRPHQLMVFRQTKESRRIA